MAADAVWRVSGKVGVTLSTSGPGATNLITGIACSFFDSIPAIHITGQINLKDSSLHNGAKPRQKGFQETNIVDMVKPITKYSVLVTDINSLPDELEKAYNIATTGRMGPVLVDVPMNVQVGHASLLRDHAYHKTAERTFPSIQVSDLSVGVEQFHHRLSHLHPQN